MHGFGERSESDVTRAPRESAAIDVLGDEDIIVEGERASILEAARNARTAAMLTGTHGVVVPPLDRPVVELPAARDVASASFAEAEGEAPEAALVRARVDALTADADDAVARMRALLELAHVRFAEGRDDDARAAAADAAALVEHAPAAHALLRVLSRGREHVAAQLTHVEHLVAHVADTLVRADFLTEKARLLEARDGPSDASVAAYRGALAHVPDHAGALSGLESALDATARSSELAAHLGRLAGLAAGVPAVAAWLHVERALLLDRTQRDRAAARAALDRALALAPQIGPVRDACLDHALVHRDDALLGELLASEASLEGDRARAACLELDAALVRLRAGDVAAALKLLERAHGRAPTSRLVDRRVAEELARVLTREGRHADALRVLDVALRFVSDAREELVALRAVITTAQRAGDHDRTILALERARVLEGDDPTLLEELDRELDAAGRHEARAVMWMREAALLDDTAAKTRALLRAAEASTRAGREADAARHREAAWLADPGAPGVFDALAERLAPAASSAAVSARISLYEQAAERTADVGKKLHYLEKVAWLWDDVAGDATRAARAYEDVLAVDARRRSAIAGLSSAALRAGDDRRLARALLAEAAVVDDDDARARAKLRAAEALASVDGERALALAAEIAKTDAVAARARELTTDIHRRAGRWELVARSLAERRAHERDAARKVALALAESDVLSRRVAQPEQALATLEAAREIAPGDPAVARAVLDVLETVGDADRLAAELERLAAEATDTTSRAFHLVRAAELAENREDGDADAVRLYADARAAAPEELLVRERLRRLGARVDVPSDVVPPVLAAMRTLDSGRTVPRGTAEDLLASGARDVATLRLAERLARRAKSAPPLANALALQAEGASGMLAQRALAGLAALVSWTLPESDEIEPWDRLVELGSRDAVVLDDLRARARRAIAGGNRPLLDLALEAATRRMDGAADETERYLLHLEVARMRRAAGQPRETAQACRDALAVEPTSVTAAVLLASAATELGDRRAAIAAATTLASITRTPRAQAALLRDAADLSAAQGDAKAAAALLERALTADPDSVLVAARLAQLQAKEGAWAELARALRKGLSAASTAEAIVPMAAELADVAKNRLRDPLLAIEALQRSREVAPEHVPALFLLAELFIGRRAWDEALESLGEVVARSQERDEKLVALAGRASILARVLGRPSDAEVDLRSALKLDAHDPRALRGLLALPVPLALSERAELLSRLVVAETQRDARLAALLDLARVRGELGDHGGAEGALVEAAALSPDATMLERLRASAGGDATTLARVLGRAIQRARESGATPGAAWLTAVGELELNLGRLDEAIDHFEEALGLEPTRDPARLSLARALAAKGRHETAAAALTPLLDSGDANILDAAFLRLLEAALTGAGRTQQADVARELRAIAGDLDERALAALRARRPMMPTNGEALSGSVLRSYVMPGSLGRHAVWDAAALATTFAGKLSRIALTDQGSASRDRVKPRAVHPLRQLFDRLTRSFELFDVELAVSDGVAHPVVACEDAVWIVAPSAMAEWPEAHAAAALARPLARIALGVPWLGHVPIEEVLAMIVAVARQVAPGFTTTPAERVEPLVSDYELRARRAIDRKRRRSLEDLEGALASAPAVPVDAFLESVLRSEARAAFLVSGDLRAAMDAVATSDRILSDALRAPGKVALSAVLARPVARDLAAFALGGDATALRRSIGSLWS